MTDVVGWIFSLYHRSRYYTEYITYQHWYSIYGLYTAQVSIKLDNIHYTECSARPLSSYKLCNFD